MPPCLQPIPLADMKHKVRIQLSAGSVSNSAGSLDEHVLPALGRWRQEDEDKESKASLVYMRKGRSALGLRSCLQKSER